MTGTPRGDEDRAPDPWTERWPEGKELVALLAPADGGTRACEAAVELADASGRDRRTLLANLAGDPPGLDDHLGSASGAGLLRAGRSGRTLREIARRPPGRRFLFLPAGTAPEEDGGGGELRAPTVGLVARVAERVREQGGRLLLFLTAGPERWPEALARRVDGLVLLDGAAAPPVSGDAAPPVLGRWPPDEPVTEPSPPPPPSAAGPGDGDGFSAAGEARPDLDRESMEDADGDSAGGWRRHRRSSGPPWTRMAAGAAVIVALAAGWWWLVREAADPGSADDAAAVEVAVDTAPPEGGDPEPEDGDSAPEDDDAGAAPERDRPAADGGPAGEDGAAPQAARPALEAAPALPYSVLIASYARWAQARERLEAWREPEGPVYFAAPTRIRGGVYWRLFAGAVPDRTSGEALMEELVERGRKDRARAWDVRPVALAFLVGTEPSGSRAEAAVEALERRGVPAYALPAAGEGDTVWAVWAGGFEAEDDASELRALLRETEIEAELTNRRGETDAR